MSCRFLFAARRAGTFFAVNSIAAVVVRRIIISYMVIAS